MALRIYNSLPCYFGAKRRLNAQIFKHVPPPSQAPTFLDPFLGGGSVALFAKARGFRVLANDLADRSVLIGRAVIENGTRKLAEDDILGALAMDVPPLSRYTESTYSPAFFLERHAKIVDQLLYHAHCSRCPVRRALIQLLTVQFIVRWRPFGDFHQAGMNQKLADFDVDECNMNLVAVTKIKGLFDKTSIERLRILIRDTNGGVFENGHSNRMHQMDAAEFLRTNQGDVAYFDPPYWGSNAYEKVYAVLDKILAGGDAGELPPSKFNTNEALGALDTLFESAKHIPHWVISFGGGKLTTSDFLALVRRHRPSATAHPVKHRYFYGDAGGRETEGKEILITASTESTA